VPPIAFSISPRWTAITSESVTYTLKVSQEVTGATVLFSAVATRSIVGVSIAVRLEGVVARATLQPVVALVGVYSIVTAEGGYPVALVGAVNELS
jgi:hypothetical protein